MEASGTSVITSIENEIENAGEIEVYPNPFDNGLNIMLNGKYSIYDLTGVLVENGECQNTCVVGKKLTSGIFMLEFNSESSLKKVKITKE